MARVNVQDAPSVAPASSPGNDYNQTQATPASFGGLIGQGEKQLGSGLDAAGQGASQVALLKQDRFNQIQTDDAFNQFQSGVTDLTFGNPGDPDPTKRGLYSVHGADALRQGPDVLNQISAMRDKIKAGLANPAQQLQFDEQSRRLLQYTSGEIARHLDQQADAYGLATNAAALKNAGDTASNTFNSDQAFGNAQAQARNASVQAAQIKYGHDLSPDLTQQALREADDHVVQARVLGWSARDPGGASNWLQNGTIMDGSGKQVSIAQAIDPQLYHSLTQHLQTLGDQSGANTIVNAAMGMPGAGAPIMVTADVRARAQAVHDEVVRQGGTGDEGWGWAANAVHESSATTAPTPGDGGISHGMFQLNKDELAQYQREHGGHMPEQDDMPTQLAFVRKQAAPYLVGASGPDGNAAVISAKFEVPAGGPVAAADRGATARLLSGGAPRPAGPPGSDPSNTAPAMPDYETAAAQVMANTAGNYKQQQLAMAELNRRFAAQKRGMVDVYESAANPLVSQMIANPTKIDPVRDIAQNPAFNAEQKNNLYNMLTKHLADYNSDGGDKDSKTYGPQFWNYYKYVNAPVGDPGRITDPQVLIRAAGPDGGLTIAGVEKLTAAMQQRRTPEGEAEASMQKTMFQSAHQTITGANDMLGIKDPKGEEIYLKFMAGAYKQIDALKKAGKTADEIYSPDSSDYVGKGAAGMKRNAAQKMADLDEANNDFAPKTEEPKKGGGGLLSSVFGKADPVDLTTNEGVKAAVRSGRLSWQEGNRLLTSKPAQQNAMAKQDAQPPPAPGQLPTKGY